MRKIGFAACLMSLMFVYAEAAPVSEDQLLKQIQLINQIPEGQLSDKTDPAFSILKSIYDEDGGSEAEIPIFEIRRAKNSCVLFNPRISRRSSIF
jgi:hypothetical protein